MFLTAVAGMSIIRIVVASWTGGMLILISKPSAQVKNIANMMTGVRDADKGPWVKRARIPEPSEYIHGYRL